MYDEILVTTDGSEGSEAAVEHAREIAEKFDARVNILYVIDIRSGSPHEVGEVLSGKFEELGKEATQDIKEDLAQEGIEAEAFIERGVPHKEILEFSEGNDIDMIVMGTHGRTGLDRILIGSVTEKVVRAADIPVLTVGR